MGGLHVAPEEGGLHSCERAQLLEAPGERAGRPAGDHVAQRLSEPSCPPAANAISRIIITITIIIGISRMIITIIYNSGDNNSNNRIIIRISIIIIRTIKLVMMLSSILNLSSISFTSAI